MSLYLTQMVSIQNDCRRCLNKAGFLFSAESNEEVDSFATKLQIPRIFNDQSGGVSVWLINERWHKLLSLDDTVILLNLADFRGAFSAAIAEVAESFKAGERARTASFEDWRGLKNAE